MESEHKESSISSEMSRNLIEHKTKVCIDLINNSTDSEPKKLFLILGRPGVGKSSFFEDLTGAHGHAGDGTEPVTQTFQIEKLMVGSTMAFIMDTPGINSGSEKATFTNIAQGLQQIQTKCRIIGVFYVKKITDRSEAIEAKLHSFLLAFCGDHFIPQVTFVTTHWSADRQKQQQRLDQNLQEWKAKRKTEFGDKGARYYQHGQDFMVGLDSVRFYDWDEDRHAIAVQAKYMINNTYNRDFAEDPQFVKQLRDGTDILQTDAAKALELGPAPSQYSDVPEGSQSEQQENQRSSRGAGPGFRSSDQSHPAEENRGSERIHSPQMNSGGTSGQQERTGDKAPNSHTPETYTWPKYLWDVVAGVQIEVTNNGVAISWSNARMQYRNSSPQQRDAGASKIDPHSVVDGMKARGLDSSLENRIRTEGEWNVKFPGTPGSDTWNSAFLRELNRRDPL